MLYIKICSYNHNQNKFYSFSDSHDDFCYLFTCSLNKYRKHSQYFRNDLSLTSNRKMFKYLKSEKYLQTFVTDCMYKTSSTMYDRFETHLATISLKNR